MINSSNHGQPVTARKVIVIDDDPEILNLIKTVLRTKGYVCYEAANGEEGLRLINEKKPDLVIVDLMMPVVSGLEVCKQMRNDPKLKDIPIIVISGIGKETGKSEDFWKIGLKSDDFMSKPFDPLDLLGRIEYIFRRQDYVSAKATDKEKKGTHKTSINLEEAKPEEVVKAFLEAWNSQDFLTEYNCMAEEMHGGIPSKEYIARRQQTYRDENGDNHIQKLRKVLNVSIRQSVANVLCEREDNVRGHTQTRRENYVLRKAANGWKIVTVRLKPES